MKSGDLFVNWDRTWWYLLLIPHVAQHSEHVWWTALSITPDGIQVVYRGETFFQAFTKVE